MTFNPAAAAAFSQAQLLAATQQHRPDADASASADALNHYLANARGLFSANGQFPFNAVQNSMETMNSLMSAGMGAAALPVMSYPPIAIQRIQEYHNSLQSASAGNNQAAAAAAAGGPFPNIIFDGTMGFHPYGMDTTRRKNATRETTLPLKNWLNKHWKNPYPSKGEKLMLAVLTKMSLTQVSTWFANARRRLKKEKKWSPPNRRADDGDDDDLADNLDRPSSSNSNESDDVKDELDEGMDTNDNRLKQLNRSHGGGDDSATPIKRPIWSIAETIHTPPNIDKSESHKPLNSESEAKLKEEASADASSTAFNLAQNMLQFYPSGLSSQQLLAVYQRMMTPQAPASFPQNICGFNPMLLAAFNQPGSAMALSADTASSTASSKQNGLSSVSPTSSTASQDPTKLTNPSSEDEKSSATPTSAVGTTTPLSTPQKSPSRSPTPSSTN
ncbi:unnamed protein product [Auanema sp. JU1783]|nr:unnamed protein product [Auanema sp. JU1783]